ADALAGETERLRLRVSQIFDRLEAQLRQILRDAEIREGQRTLVSAGNSAATLMAYTEGRISQFVRTEFRESPTANWPEHWTLLSSGLFRSPGEPPVA